MPLNYKGEFVEESINTWKKRVTNTDCRILSTKKTRYASHDDVTVIWRTNVQVLLYGHWHTVHEKIVNTYFTYGNINTFTYYYVKYCGHIMLLKTRDYNGKVNVFKY